MNNITYRLKRNNGDFFASIPSNVILSPNIPSSTPTPLNLVGRNVVSYGDAQNENFLWLTENFANVESPVGAVKGQLWYDYTNDDGSGIGGELKLAPIDSPSSTEWLTVPTIALANTEPSESHPGRMLIYKKNQLKIRMDNEWYTVQTELPSNKQYQELLEVRNNSDIYNGMNTTLEFSAGNEELVARFNDGGYITPDGSLGGIDKGMLKYGTSYQWHADVIARQANDPSIFKSWRFQGGFFVDSEKTQKTYSDPDPRKISQTQFYASKNVICVSSTSAQFWDIAVLPDIKAPPAGTSIADIVDGDFYGLAFIGNCFLDSTSKLKTQWTISLTISGASTSKHSLYSNL